MSSQSRQRLSEEELIAAWHSDVPLADIAKRHHVHRKFIAMSWKLLKLHHKLPDTARACQRNGWRNDSNNGVYKQKPVEPEPEDRYDGRPSVYGDADRWVEDPLLEALRREHHRPRSDIYPGSELRDQ